MIIFLSILAFLFVFVLFVIVFMKQEKFGITPSGKRLRHIGQQENFREGKFQNLNHTPDFAEGESIFSVMLKILFSKSKRNKPAERLPSVKTDLLNLPADKDVLVWFGHSSYFMQIDGKKILVDPVFSGAASPLPGSVKSFPGSDVYSTDDIPEIDYLFLSHDHWDHLDHSTVKKLKPKIKRIITGLGTGAHLERWGFHASLITEKNWHEEIKLEDGFSAYALPARHFSGRGFRRQKAVWLSFALQTPSMNIFLGGDSGFDTHFEAIGKQYGPFDLAILECGQYNQSWKYIHSMPEEVVQEAKDLRTKKVLPVHWAKFALALHDWDEPIRRLSAAAEKENIPLLTPMIGEQLNLKEENDFKAWWKDIR